MSASPGPPGRRARNPLLFWKEAPISRHGGIDVEEKTPSYQDYWFANEKSEPVSIGLKNKNCKCTAVEFFLLPEEGRRRLPFSTPSPWSGLAARRACNALLGWLLALS